MSETKVEEDFENIETVKCPWEITLVDEAEEPLSPDDSDVISINSAGFVEINQEFFKGGNLLAKVKVITSFNVPVFKEIKVIDKCPS